MLVGRELQHDFAAEGFFANVSEKFVGDTDVDVAFEQGFANFRERGVQVLFGELALAAKILESALQFFCKVFKHERKFSEARDQNSVFDDSSCELRCDWTYSF